MQLNKYSILLALSAAVAAAAGVYYLSYLEKPVRILPPQATTTSAAPAPVVIAHLEGGESAQTAMANETRPPLEASAHPTSASSGGTKNPGDGSAPGATGSTSPASPARRETAKSNPPPEVDGVVAANSVSPNRPESGTPDLPVAARASVPAAEAPVPQAVDISVPAGGRLPLVLAESDPDRRPGEPINQAREEILASMTMKFARDVAKAEEETDRTAVSPEEYLARWQGLVAKSDEQFRAFFGDDAYMKWSIQNHLKNFEARSSAK